MPSFPLPVRQATAFFTSGTSVQLFAMVKGTLIFLPQISVIHRN